MRSRVMLLLVLIALFGLLTAGLSGLIPIGPSTLDPTPPDADGRLGGPNGSAQESFAGVVTFTDTFEAPVTKGVIDASTPFAMLPHDETWGSVYREGTTYYLYTGYHRTIGVRTSTDGVTWGDRTVILEAPGPGVWNSWMCYCPTVWREGSTYHMLFAGAASDGVVGVGHASSGSATHGWALDPANPVYTNPPGGWSGGGAEPWGAIKVGGTYYLWVNNYGGIGERQLGLVTSTDLHTWTADTRNPIYTGQRFCPCVFEYGGAYYMLVTYQFSGSDYAELELYRCADPRFYPEDRQFLGTVLFTPRDPTTGLGGDLDTPTPILTDLSNACTGDPIPFYYSVASAANEWTMGKFTLSPSAFTQRVPLADTYTGSNEPSAAFSLSTDSARSGSRSLKIDDTGSNEYYDLGINRARGRVSFWVNQSDDGVCWIQGFGDRGVQAITFQLYWMKIQWKDGATLEGGTRSRTKSAWYHVDITFDTAAETWGFLVKDTAGATFIGRTGLALSAPVTEITRLRLWRDSDLSGIFYFDDLTIRGDV